MSSTVKRSKNQEDVWNQHPAKLSVLVMEAKDLVSRDKNGLADPYCKVSLDDHTLKTEVVKKSLAPQWNHFFLFDVPSSALDLTFEVFDHNTLNDKFMGRYSFGPIEKNLIDEIVRDLWIPLDYKEKDKKKISEGKKIKESKRVGGQLHVRMLYSCLPESKILLKHPVRHTFYYKQYCSHFGTGDLILFNNIGMTNAFTSLAINSPFSSLGMIIVLPNKFTEEDEYYVIELTRNVNHALDAVSETVSRRGLCIFRLIERLHNIHATKVWWAPLKLELDIDISKLEATVRDLHAMDETTFLSKDILEVDEHEDQIFNSLKQFFNSEFGIGTKKQKQDLYEMDAPLLVYRLLRSCSTQILAEPEAKNVTSITLLNRYYQNPVLVRSTEYEADRPRAPAIGVPPEPAAILVPIPQTDARRQRSSSTATPRTAVHYLPPIAGSQSSGSSAAASGPPQNLYAPVSPIFPSSSPTAESTILPQDEPFGSPRHMPTVMDTTMVDVTPTTPTTLMSTGQVTLPSSPRSTTGITNTDTSITGESGSPTSTSTLGSATDTASKEVMIDKNSKVIS